MKEKYKKIFQTPKVLYAPKSPVIIREGALFLNCENGSVCAQLKFQNISDKQIVLLKVKLVLRDAIDRVLKEIEEQYLDLSARHGAKFGEGIRIDLPEKATRSFNVSVSEVCFSDKTVWTCGDGEWKSVPSPLPLASKFASQYAVLGYRQTLCPKAICLPVRYEDIWVCSCGCINKNDTLICRHCNANLELMEGADGKVLENDVLYDKASKLISSAVSTQIKEGVEILESIKTWKDADEKIAIARESYKDAIENEEKRKAKRQERIKSIKRKGIIACSVSIVLVISIIASIFIFKENKYKKAQNYLNNQDYQQAMGLFDDLDGYKDSRYYYGIASDAMAGKYIKVIDKLGLTEFHIPEGTEVIKDEQFKDVTNLKKIVIPSSVTTIGTNAFYGCSAEIAWAQGSKMTVLGEFAFAGYKGTSLVVPNGVTCIEYKAFAGCIDLVSVEIPNGVTQIGVSAFESCQNLTSVVIPDGVTQISERAFADCFDLISVEMSNSVTQIGASAFSGCKNLTSVVIPDGVTQIRERAFADCFGLISVEMSNSVTQIGVSAFENCYNLTGVEIPDSVEHIKNKAFLGCYNLESVEIGSGVREIGSEAFSGCKKIESLVIGNNVTYIGQSTFKGCIGLTSVEIGSGVREIGSEAFSGCEKIESLVIGNNVTHIGKSTFKGCIGLTSVEIGDNIEEIKESTFSGCINLANVKIGNGVTKIGTSAFSNCSNLTSIAFGAGLKKISSYAFSSCSSLESVIIPDGVTAVESFAFKNCSGLTSVVVPDSVTEIGESVFYGCSNIQSITIPFIGPSKNGESSSPVVFAHIFGTSKYDGSTAVKQYYRSVVYTYYIPSNLTSITVIGGVIRDEAFYKFSFLTSIVIGEKVTSIGSEAFRGCSNLISVVIPESVTKIGSYAFCECSNLTIVVIPESVTEIATGTFSRCNNLTSVVIPESVTKIGSYAFSECSNLTSITIPDSVTEIGGYAFSGCSNLINVVIGAKATNKNHTVFSFCSSLTNVYYKGTAEEWNVKFEVVLGNNELQKATKYYYIENVADVPTDGENYWHYDENGEIAIW